jgi:hypothetical protein
MLQSTMHTAAVQMAAPADNGPLNISGLQALLVSVGGLVIIVVGLAIVASSRKGDMAKTASTSAIALIGITFMAMGAGAVAVVAFGSEILDMFVNS